MKHASLGTKLTAAFGGVLFLTVVIGICALRGMTSLTQRLETATSASARKLELAGEIGTATSDMLVHQRGMYLAAFQNSPDALATSRASLRKSSETARKSISDIAPLLITAKGKQLTSRLSDLLTRWAEAIPELERLCVAGDAAGAAKRGYETTFSVYREINGLSTELSDNVSVLLAEEKKAGSDEARYSAWLMYACLALCGLVAGVVWLVIRNMNRDLRAATLEMSETADQVATAANQVATASQSLAQGASEQAATLEETSASTEELTSMTHRNTENSHSAANLMQQVDGQVGHANRTLGDMVISMEEINSSADKISRIIKVIDEIAFQTNILALNAAVEAARAGDAGMGFAVVADEVRNLAQRCAQAARDTAQLIEESITRSGEGKQRLQEVANAITAITGGAKKVKALVEDVSSGSNEQTRGIDQINRAVSQMEQVTQRSAATAEESASSSEELSAMAATMRETVSGLAALVGASSGTTASRRRNEPKNQSAMSVGEL